MDSMTSRIGGNRFNKLYNQAVHSELHSIVLFHCVLILLIESYCICEASGMIIVLRHVLPDFYAKSTTFQTAFCIFQLVAGRVRSDVRLIISFGTPKIVLVMNVVGLLRTAPRLRSCAAVSARGLASKVPHPDPPPKDSSEAGKAGELDSNTPGPSEPSRQTALSLDFSPEAGAHDGPTQRTGARSSKDSLSSIERKRRLMGRAALGAFGLGAIAGTIYLGREWEPEELAAKRMVS